MDYYIHYSGEIKIYIYVFSLGNMSIKDLVSKLGFQKKYISGLTYSFLNTLWRTGYFCHPVHCHVLFACTFFISLALQEGLGSSFLF